MPMGNWSTFPDYSSDVADQAGNGLPYTLQMSYMRNRPKLSGVRTKDLILITAHAPNRRTEPAQGLSKYKSANDWVAIPHTLPVKWETRAAKLPDRRIQIVEKVS